MSTTPAAVRAEPFLFPQFCKACGRCIEACPRGCIAFSDAIDPATGLVPVVVDLERCNACGLCLDACPEPYGLMPRGEGPAPVDPEAYFRPRPRRAPPETIPDRPLPMPGFQPLVLKGTHAAAIGALLAGCRHFFGYPITPSSEGAELMARLLPDLDGVFVQAVSEVAAINMMYGCGAAGKRAMTFTSSPGFSLMLEGISYMIGAEIPGVVVDIMRGGPGLGNIAPEQSDIKQLCRGLGHGHTHAPVLAPSTPQEMLDSTMLAFELAMRYRHPVIVAGDGYLGQITGRVTLPDHRVEPGLPSWAVAGDAAHRGNLLCSIRLAEADLESHNRHLDEKYRRIAAREQRSDRYAVDDADWLLVACNTPARMAKRAVRALRERGVRAGLFRPITLWPFPIDALLPALERVRGLVVVEAGAGQLEDELRLALSHAGAPTVPIAHVRRLGGVLPQAEEIVSRVETLATTRAGAVVELMELQR